MLNEIFAIIAPILLCTSLGFSWSKSGRRYDSEFITLLVGNFATPCLIFYSLSSLTILPNTILKIGGAALAANIFFIATGSLFLRVFGLPQRSFLQSISFPNVGNMGMPLCYFAFGKEGLALAVTFFAIYAIFQMTVGTAFLSGALSRSFFLKQPIIPATILATIFLVTETAVPAWLANSTKLLGDITIPLMLFTLGHSLSRLQVKRLGVPLLLSVFRILSGFAGGLLMVKLFRLTGSAAGVVVLECTMPAAVFSYLFAKMYERDPEDVAGVVIISTVLGFILFPPLLWYVLRFYG